MPGFIDTATPEDFGISDCTDAAIPVKSAAVEQKADEREWHDRWC